MLSPMIGVGPTEIMIVLLVVILLFGAAKLPELSRAVGQSLRIFKAETKGLINDDKSPEADGDSSNTSNTSNTRATPEQREIEARRVESERVSPEQARRDDTTA
jgi:sec-independent protein translocase protein TatA